MAYAATKRNHLGALGEDGAAETHQDPNGFLLCALRSRIPIAKAGIHQIFDRMAQRFESPPLLGRPPATHRKHTGTIWCG